MGGHYRVGTRGSKLALWQAEHVISRLRAVAPAAEFEIVTIRTTADKRQDVPLHELGDKSLFLKEIEAALLAGHIDLAVHSLKDVPSRLEPPFALAAVLEREDPRDVLLPHGLAALPKGARIGTSSLRREAQLRALRPDLQFVPIRGNVDTRLRKLSGGEYDAIALAAAGLLRLSVPIASDAYLDPGDCLPAPGQAAICVETLAGSASTVAAINHSATRAAIEAERAFAAKLDAGCQVPLGAHARHIGGKLHLDTVVASVDGARLIRARGEGTNPVELGDRVAQQALASGAAELLAAAATRA